MTLDDLYRDWRKKAHTRPSYAQTDIETHANWYDVDSAKGLMLHPSEIAAKLYIIARDEGLNAAMLWKLQQP